MKRIALIIVAILTLSVFSCERKTKETKTSIDRPELPTTVIVIRHAEKEIIESEEDPNLTELGYARAEMFADRMENYPITAIYTTKYKRNKLTVDDIARRKKIKPLIYEGHDFEGLSKTIREKHYGEHVVVCGHSNTVLEIIEALGGKRPIEEINDEDYSYMFIVEIEGEKVKVKVQLHSIG
jgi:2,3-bisphosphoglycerate-dependent phosphoglycerate mutase